MRGYIRLKSYCRLQSGREGYVIFNLERGNYAFVPQTIHTVLTAHSQYTLSELEEFAGSTGKLEAYIDHLIANDYLTETLDPEKYPPIADEWSCPELVLSAVLEVGPASLYNLWDVLAQLRALNCKHIEVRVLEKLGVSFIEQLLAYTVTSTFRTLDVVADWHIISENETLINVSNKVEQWLALYPKLSRFLLYNSPELDTVSEQSWPLSVLRTTQNLAQIYASDSVFRKDKLYISTPFYTESLRFNPFYNRKACIAADGSVKNCLNQVVSFGNVASEQIADIVSRADFQYLWQQNNALNSELADSVFRFVRLARVGD